MVLDQGGLEVDLKSVCQRFAFGAFPEVPGETNYDAVSGFFRKQRAILVCCAIVQSRFYTTTNLDFLCELSLVRE